MITKDLQASIIEAINQRKLSEQEPLKLDSLLVYRMDSEVHKSRPGTLRPAGNFEHNGIKYAAYFNTAALP